MTRRTKISHFAKGLGQSLLSLSFNLGGMLAGTLLALNLDVLSATSWALLLFPGILSLRGAIGGLFCGRLSTGLHVGTVKASYTGNTRRFYVILDSVIALTLVSSVTMGLAGSLFGVAFAGITLLDSLAILAVITSTMGLSLVAISPITVGIAVLSFKKGLDPDVTVYPVISTVADVLVTICYIIVLGGFFSSEVGRLSVMLFDFAFFFVVCYIVVRNHAEPVFVKTMKESLLTLTIVAVIVNVTGSFLAKISQAIGNKREIYVVYPALIDTVGDVGSIIGSTATTNLTLGVLKPTFRSMKRHLAVVAAAWIASIIMFVVFFSTASFMQGIAVVNYTEFALRILLTNILAVSAIVFIAYAIAIITYKKGLDPDNLVIPIESSLADSVTTLALLLALTINA